MVVDVVLDVEYFVDLVVVYFVDSVVLVVAESRSVVGR